MAKMTLDGLKTFVSTYVDASKQAGTWVASTDNTFDLLDKVAKTITIDASFNDPLTIMNGDDLPLGKTIEEYFVDLSLPVDFDKDGATALAPHLPSVENAVYNYTLGEKTIQTTVRYNDLERASVDAMSQGEMVAKITERLYNSYTLYTFQQKKQLLGNMILKCSTATNKATLMETLAIPTDVATGEDFIKRLKIKTEEASLPNTGNNLGNYLIGVAPSLTLFIKKGVMPSLEVDTMSGAFHREDLAIPATVQMVDDFGNDATNTYAVLVDTRGIKLHRGYHAVRQQVNGQGDFINYFDHSENTGFISKSVFVHCFKSA